MVSWARPATATAIDPYIPPSVATHSGMDVRGLLTDTPAAPVIAESTVIPAVPGTGSCVNPNWSPCAIDSTTQGWRMVSVSVVAGAVEGRVQYFDCRSGSCVDETGFDGGSPEWHMAKYVGVICADGRSSAGQRVNLDVDSAALLRVSLTGGLTGSGQVCSGSTVSTLYVSEGNFVERGNPKRIIDGFRVVVGIPSSPLTAVTVCGDGSRLTQTFPVGQPVELTTVCPSATVSAAVSVGGVELGRSDVTAGFTAWGCIRDAGSCVLMATVAGGTPCPSDGSVRCSYWTDTAPAQECGWYAGGTQVWTLLGKDCDDARSHGAWDAPPDATPSPTPTPDPTGDPGADAVVKAVQENTKRVTDGLGSIYRGMEKGFNDTVNGIGDVVAGVTSIPAAISRAVVPDAGVMSGLVARGKGALGAPLAGWTDALGSIGGAWESTSAGCQGPGLPLFNGVELHTYYVLDACTEPLASVAPLVRAGATVLLLMGGLWTCVRNLSSALGYNA